MPNEAGIYARDEHELTELATSGVQYNLTGLEIPEGLTFPEWESLGQTLLSMHKAIHWWLGDWLRYGERVYGETYAQASCLTGFDVITLQTDVWLAGKIESSRRREDLDWSTHREVAALPVTKQEEILDKAVAEGLSRQEVRELVRRERTMAILQKTERPLPLQTIELICGDMLKVLPGLGTFDLVIADPPYGVTDWAWDEFDGNYLVCVERWLKAVKAILNDSYHLFWFCSPAFAADIEMLFRGLGLPIKSRIVWHRRNMALGSDAREKFIDTWEMIFHAGNKPLNFPTEWNEGRFDVQTFAVPQTNYEDAKVHPTQKPLGLIQRLVDFGSLPGDRVLDPFAGGGTTGLACLDRECVLIEKDAEYIGVIKERLGL